MVATALEVAMDKSRVAAAVDCFEQAQFGFERLLGHRILRQKASVASEKQMHSMLVQALSSSRTNVKFQLVKAAEQSRRNVRAMDKRTEEELVALKRRAEHVRKLRPMSAGGSTTKKTSEHAKKQRKPLKRHTPAVSSGVGMQQNSLPGDQSLGALPPGVGATAIGTTSSKGVAQPKGTGKLKNIVRKLIGKKKVFSKLVNTIVVNDAPLLPEGWEQVIDNCEDAFAPNDEYFEGHGVDLANSDTKKSNQQVIFLQRATGRVSFTPPKGTSAKG
jgi:hypothetical protein